MSKTTIIILIVIAVLAVIAVVLYFLGKKAQKKQDEQQEAMNAAKQTVSMLIIDKKRMKLKDAGLPQAVIEQTPKLMRSSKLPIVKAKVGPQVLSLVCDAKIFDGGHCEEEDDQFRERAFLEQVGEANLTALAYGQEPYQPHDDEKDCQKVEKVFDGTSQVLHNFCL